MAGVPPIWGPLAGLAQAAYPAIQQYGPMAYGFYKKLRNRSKNLTYTGGIGKGYRRGAQAGFKKAVANANETKSFDTAIGTLNCYKIATNALISNCSIIPQDHTNHGRNGKKIQVIGILVRGRVKAGITQTVPQLCGWQLVTDFRPRGAIASAEDIHKTDNSPLALPGVEYGASRFKTLAREIYMIQGEGDTLTGNSPWVYINRYIKTRFEIEWEEDDTGGNTAGTLKNMIDVSVLGELATDDTAKPAIDLNVRVYYKDI